MKPIIIYAFKKFGLKQSTLVVTLSLSRKFMKIVASKKNIFLLTHILVYK